MQETNPELYAKYYESVTAGSHGNATTDPAAVTAASTLTDALSESLEKTKLESELANAQLAKAILKEEAKAEKERKRKEASLAVIKQTLFPHDLPFDHFTPSLTHSPRHFESRSKRYNDSPRKW